MIGKSRLLRPLYLEPLDLLSRQSQARHEAVPALGGSAAALSIAVWRPGGAAPRTVLPASDVPQWLDSLSEADRSRAAQILANWRETPGFPGVPSGSDALVSLMGVVNLTPDSFYAASRQPDFAGAIASGHRLKAEGAAILDIGGQSTRPGSNVVSEPQELATILPVIESLTANTDAVLSIDTVRPRVAEAAITAGARIVNDVSGLMPAAALGEHAGLIIGHMRGNPATMQKWPRSERGIFSLYDWLEQRIETLVADGISRDLIAIDPGFGFGKAVSHNRAIIRHLPILTGLGVTIAIGLSRKASLGFISGAGQAADRLPPSLAAALAAASHGAAILRVHDVAATRQALQIVRFFR